MEGCATSPNTGNWFIPPTSSYFPIILYRPQFFHHNTNTPFTFSFISVRKVHSAIYFFFFFRASYHIWRWLTSTIKIVEYNPVGTAVAELNQCTSPFPLHFLRIIATFPELIVEIFNRDRCRLAASARPLQYVARPGKEVERKVWCFQLFLSQKLLSGSRQRKRDTLFCWTCLGFYLLYVYLPLSYLPLPK